MMNGVWFDGSSIEGFAGSPKATCICARSGHLYCESPGEMDLSTARVICDVHMPDGTPFAGDPRYVLKRQLARAARLGLDVPCRPRAGIFCCSKYMPTAICCP
jgi:glutamine synthetase